MIFYYLEKNSALLYEEHFFHYSSILSTLFINIISSIISAIAYIIITTAVNITIDDVLLNITSIPANNEIIERINTTAQALILALFSLNDILIFIKPAYAIHIPIIILTIEANVFECVIISIPNNIATIP